MCPHTDMCAIILSVLDRIHKSFLSMLLCSELKKLN